MSTTGLSKVSEALPDPGEEPAQRTWVVGFAGVAAFLGLYVTQPILPMLQQLYHASKTEVSMTLTASTMGVAVAAPLIGAVADRLGRKRVIVWSATLLALATMLDATATGLPELIFWRFLQGLFTPGVFAVILAYVQEEWAGKGAGRATAIYVAGTAVGGFCGRMSSGIIAARWNWHWTFVIIGLMCGVSALMLQLWLPRERHFTGRVKGQSMFAGMASHLRDPRLLATFTAGFGVLFTLVAAYTYATFHLAGEPFRLGPMELGSLFVTYLFGAAVTAPCGRVIDRYGHRATVILAMGMGITGMFITLIPNLWAVCAGLTLCCSGVFVAQSTTTSYIGVAARRSKALAVGLYVTFYYVGGSVGAELPGYVWHLGGWTACVGLVVLVQVIILAVALAFWSPVRTREDVEPEALSTQS